MKEIFTTPALFIAIGMLFLTGSCGKNSMPWPPYEVVEGTVLEDVSNKPISGATLFTTKCKTTSGNACIDYGESFDLRTDENGRFSMDKSIRVAEMSASHLDYWPYDKSFGGAILNNDLLNFKLMRAIPVMVHLKNVNNAYSSSFRFEFTVESPAATSQVHVFPLGYLPADTIVFMRGFGNHSNIVKWNITDGNTNNANEFPAVTASASDTIKLELEY